MEKFTVVLPTKQHNGTSNAKAISRIKMQIAVLTGGFTTTVVSGGWYDKETGRMYTDRSVQVSTVTSSPEVTRLLEQQVPAWAVALQQIEVMYEVIREKDGHHVLEVYFVAGTREQDMAV